MASTSHDETWRVWDLEKRQEILLQVQHQHTRIYIVCKVKYGVTLFLRALLNFEFVTHSGMGVSGIVWGSW